MSDSIKLTSHQSPSWESIKDFALQNDKLQADIRVGSGKVEIAPSGLSDLWEDIEVGVGLEERTAYASKKETLKNLNEALAIYFSEAVANLTKEAGIDSSGDIYSKYYNEAIHSLQQITEKLDSEITGKSSASTSQAIQKTHDEAVSSLISLRQKFSTPDLTPQIIRTSDGKYCVIKPATLPENLALSGGGVKGAGYVGAYQAMEEAGILQNLQQVAGSSAGAMTAALIAGGLDAAAFKEASDRISFSSVLLKSSSNSVVDGATDLVGGIGFAGTYAEDEINQEISISIKNFLNNVDLEKDLTGQDWTELKISVDEKQFVAQLKADLNADTTVLITFKQLAILRKIDPSKFKELTVTGFDRTTQKEKYYNDVSAPNMAIAKAVRISMALPGAFKEVLSVGDDMEDGGIGSNIPAEVFKAPNEKTLLLGFDNNGSFKKIVYDGRTAVPSSVWEKLQSLFAGNPDLQLDQTADNEKLKNAGPNALDVYHGDLGTESFAASEDQIKAAQLQAKVRMREQLSLLQNQATYDVFDNLELAMLSMNDDQLTAIVKKYTADDPIAQAAQHELTDRTWTIVDEDSSSA